MQKFNSCVNSINPLFTLVSSVNCLYITNKEVFPISSMEIGFFILGLHKLLWQSLAYCIRPLSVFWGTPCVGDLGGFGRFLWGYIRTYIHTIHSTDTVSASIASEYGICQ
jgi:hypothetical protein